VKFATEQQPGWFAERSERLRTWFEHVFASTPSPARPQAPVTARNVTRREPGEGASSAASASDAAEGASASALAGGTSGAADGASAAGAAAEESRALPPLLTAPGSASGPTLPGDPVHGEARGAGTAASAPTPTPDDVMPPDAAGVDGQAGRAGNAP